MLLTAFYLLGSHMHRRNIDNNIRMGINVIHQCSNDDPMITIYTWYLICTLPGEISCSTAVSSSSWFSWFLLGLFPLLNSYLGCYKLRASSQDSLRPVYSPAALSQQP